MFVIIALRPIVGKRGKPRLAVFFFVGGPPAGPADLIAVTARCPDGRGERPAGARGDARIARPRPADRGHNGTARGRAHCIAERPPGPDGGRQCLAPPGRAHARRGPESPLSLACVFHIGRPCAIAGKFRGVPLGRAVGTGWGCMPLRVPRATGCRGATTMHCRRRRRGTTTAHCWRRRSWRGSAAKRSMTSRCSSRRQSRSRRPNTGFALQC